MLTTFYDKDLLDIIENLADIYSEEECARALVNAIEKLNIESFDKKEFLIVLQANLDDLLKIKTKEKQNASRSKGH